MPELGGMDTHTSHCSPVSPSRFASRQRTPRGAPVLLTTAIVLVLGIVQAATTAANTHLQYFGFTGGCETETYVQETAPFSNVCMIDIQDERLLDHEWVTKMMVREMRLVVATHTTFYEQVEVPGHQRAAFDLRADFRQRWQEAIAGKERALYALAAFFYVADEPGWTGISRSELAAAHEEIKQSVPRARTVTSFNRMLEIAWFEGQDVPTDAVSYHQYGVFDPRVDPDYQANVAIIKSHAPGKEFFYTLDSWWNRSRHGGEGLAPEDMAEVTRNYYLMASEDPDAIGLVGFHWPSFAEGTGARDLPRNVKWQYWSIGSQITGKCLGPVDVDAETALFFGNCSYFATLQYEALEGSAFAAAMPRERSYGTWVLEEGDVVGGLKVRENDEILVYPSFYTDVPSIIRIYDVADGRLVSESRSLGPHDRKPIRLPYRSVE